MYNITFSLITIIIMPSIIAHIKMNYGRFVWRRLNTRSKSGQTQLWSQFWVGVQGANHSIFTFSWSYFLPKPWNSVI